jgi:hypothetical protein
VNEYRTPEERQACDEQNARIREVLDQAIRDGASCIIAMTLDEPRAVVEHWTDAVWDGLRDGLSGDAEHPRLRGEDPLVAVALLLDERMQAEAAMVLRGMRDPR